MEQVFADAGAELRVPGIAYGVVHRGQLVLAGGAGVRELGGPDPVGPGTIMRIASMTKSVTAACLLMLRDEGGLGLDDPVERYVPQLRGLPLPSADAAPLTVRQLLTMSGGLVEDDPWADRHLAMTEEEFDSLLGRGIPFDTAPGQVFEYSNLGYGIVGRVVREVSGMRLTEMATRRLFQPLGMRDTVWETDACDPRRVAKGYRLEEDRWIEEPALPDGAFAPMGGLWTTVEDFARYVTMQLAAWPARDDPDPYPLRRSSRREMQQPLRLHPAPEAKSPWLPGAGYGFGLISGATARDGRVVCHSGGLPGFGSHVQWLPDRGLGVFAFGNLTYAPMRPVVNRAIDVLAESGVLAPTVVAPGPELARALERVLRLYQSWDPELARALAADNLFLDVPEERRRAELERLRQEHGRCLEATQASSAGAMRGSWRLRCERGAIELTIWLAPTVPASVQVLRLAGAEGS